jgi:lysophospholipase L1-like esterase
MMRSVRALLSQLPRRWGLGGVLIVPCLLLTNCSQPAPASSSSTGGVPAGGSAGGGASGVGGGAGGGGGAPLGVGGGVGAGGTPGTGGSTSAGGTTGAGGAATSAGGQPGSGGLTAAGGGPASGGTTGSLATGGNSAGSGGSPSTGGMSGTGGAGDRDASVPDSGAGDLRRDGVVRDGAGVGGTGAGGSTAVGTGGSGSGGAGGSSPDGGTANITVWLAGDSTVANGSTPCPVGWGKQFQALFNSHVTVTNSAQGGRSVQTWLYDVSTTMGANGECVLNATTYLSAWTTMLAGMKTGDYLFIQFGINDGDSTCNRHVGTALFQTYYGMMAQAAKDRGANPIFVTPVSSISCSGAKAVGSRGTYATATRQAGTTYGVPIIDLEQLSAALYNSLGFCPLPGADTATTFESGAIGDFFCEDHTHFEAAGATQIAGLIAKALRDQGLGLASYLK